MLRLGDRVRINIPPEEQAALELMRFNGLVTRVVKKVPVFAGTNGTYRLNYYHLKSITAPNGKPFCFIEEWLVKEDKERKWTEE